MHQKIKFEKYKTIQLSNLHWVQQVLTDPSSVSQNAVNKF